MQMSAIVEREVLLGQLFGLGGFGSCASRLRTGCPLAHNLNLQVQVSSDCANDAECHQRPKFLSHSFKATPMLRVCVRARDGISS